MSLAVLGTIMTAGVALFPFVMPSSENPVMSLTLWDSASSKYTLNVMLYVVIIFIPLFQLADLSIYEQNSINTKRILKYQNVK